MRQQRVEEEACELAVIGWIRNAEQVLGTGSNNQFIDQRVAFAVHLPPNALSADRSIGSPHADLLTIGFTIRSDYGLLIARTVKLPIHCQHCDRDFQHNRVDVESS